MNIEVIGEDFSFVSEDAAPRKREGRCSSMPSTAVSIREEPEMDFRSRSPFRIRVPTTLNTILNR